MPFVFEDLSAQALNELPRSQTVVFIPIGPIEDHGPHLPVGSDLFEARELARLTAERLERELPGWKTLLLAPLPLSVESDTSALAITVRAHVLRDWLVDCCRSLNRAGFRYFACFSGHLGPRQLTAIEDAGRLLRGHGLARFFARKSRPILVSASSALVDRREALRSPLWPDPSEHGGARDTSVALALDPKQVAPAFAQLPPQARTGSWLTRLLDYRKGRRAGYWGKPSEGRADIGRELLQRSVDEAFIKLRAVLEGARADHVFKSWYSVFPPNRSFFKVWILLALVTVLLAGWIYLSLDWLLGA